MIAELTEKIKKNIKFFEAFFVFLGLVTSIYLISYKSRGYDIGVCGIEYNIINCDKVIFSEYSNIFGIDLGIIALLWFIIYIVLRYLEKYSNVVGKILNIHIVASVLFVLYLIYIELFVLRAVCILCTIIHIVIVILAMNRYYFLYKTEQLL